MNIIKGFLLKYDRYFDNDANRYEFLSSTVFLSKKSMDDYCKNCNLSREITKCEEIEIVLNEEIDGGIKI